MSVQIPNAICYRSMFLSVPSSVSPVRLTVNDLLWVCIHLLYSHQSVGFFWSRSKTQVGVLGLVNSTTNLSTGGVSPVFLATYSEGRNPIDLQNPTMVPAFVLKCDIITYFALFTTLYSIKYYIL